MEVNDIAATLDCQAQEPGRPAQPSSPLYPNLDSDDAFRVMYLEPGVDNDELHVRLEVVHHSHSPTYEAISYAWGDVARKEVIQTKAGPLHVTRNLIDALRAIRYPHTERCLWADAICIDQENLLERNHQVKQMAQLFSNASTVIVWLGVDSNGFGHGAFRCARLIADPKRRHIVMGNPEYSRHAIDLLRSLAARPWFQRIWTMQEIGLASRGTCLCGESELDWDVLASAYQFLMLHDQSLLVLPETFRSGLDILVHKWAPSTRVSFLDLIESVQNRSSTDPRDRIFALLAHPSASIGEVPAERRSIIDADYRLSPRQVFTRAAMGIMQQTRNLDVLSHIRRGETMDFERFSLPSWVPAWYAQQSVLPLTKQMSFNACGMSPVRSCQDMPEVNAEGELRTSGVWCDRLLHVSDDWGLSYVHDWKANFSSMSGGASDTKDWSTSLYEILDKRAVPPMSQPYIVRDDLDVLENVFHRFGHLPGKKTQFIHLLRLIESEWQMFQPRALFITEGGRLGLGVSSRVPSWRMRPGDDVFVLQRGRVPFILRIGTGGRYRLIGDCYIQPLMDGEAWTLPTSQRTKVAII